jgi:hypothetical protein
LACQPMAVTRCPGDSPVTPSPTAVTTPMPAGRWWLSVRRCFW